MQPPEETRENISPRERALADFVENAVVGLHWVASDGTILWANQSELDLLGYAPEEYIGHHIAEFHADQPVINDILTRLTADEKLSNYEARLRHKNGSIKQVLVSSSVRFEDNQFVHTRCFTIDITERKQAENRILSLYQLSGHLAEAMTPQDVVAIIMEQAIPMMGASSGLVARLANCQIESVADSTQACYPSFLDTRSPLLTESIQRQEPVWQNALEALQSQQPDLSQLSNSVPLAQAAIPLMIDKRVIGVLGLLFSTPQSFDEHDRRFMIAVVQQCAQSFERTRLAEESRDLAVLEERQRLARDLHDSVSQSLFSIYTIAQVIPRLWERNQDKARIQLDQLATIARGASAEMRTLLLELRPANLIKLTLQELFVQLVNSVQARKQIAVTTHVDLTHTLPEDVHIALYRIVQESLNNMVKHSQATTGQIDLTSQDDQVILRIRDNGSGFDMDQTAAGLGLSVMRERATIIGAALTLTSTPQQGTEIVVTWTPHA